MFLLFAICYAAATKSSPLEIYVSSSMGSDDNSGFSEQSPVKSLDHGIALAISLNRPIIRAEGNFVLSKKITFTHQHNGLTIDKWLDKAPAVISGGISISPKLWNLKEGIWSAMLPNEILSTINVTSVIFVNGKRRTIVRTPTKRWNHSLVPGKNQKRNKYGFVFSDKDIDPSWKIDKSSLHLWRVAAFHSWTKAYHHVEHIYIDNNTIIFKEPAKFPYGDYVYASDRRYYFEGIPEIPLKSGMWRYKVLSNEGVEIQYSPFPEEIPLNETTTVIPKLEQLFSIYSANNITISNVILSDTAATCKDACDDDVASMAPGAITIGISTGIHIVNISLIKIEGSGIRATNSPKLFISRIYAHLIGGGGIFINNCSKAVVNNSYVKSYGQRFPAGPGIHMSKCLNGTVAHNDLSDGFYNGLSGGGTHDSGAFTRFEYNLVHDNGKSGDDGICDYSGIHLGTTGSYKPLYISHNIFRNITAFHNGGGGIYLDVSSTAVQVEGNLVHNVAFAPFQWHVNPGVPMTLGGTPTRIINNVFVANAQNDFYASKGNIALHWDAYSKAYFTKNVIFIDSTAAPSHRTIFSGLPCARFNPASLNCTLNYLNSFQEEEFESNIYWNTSASYLSSTFPGKNCSNKNHNSCSNFQQWKDIGHDKSSVHADPEFKNIDAGDFRITSKVALALGIIPLKVQNVGPDWKYILP